MKVLYVVNLNNYYSEHSNTFYSRELVTGEDGVAKITVDEFIGYLDYKLFDKEDEARAHKEARELLQGDLDKIISDMNLTNDFIKAVRIIKSNKYIETIKLKDRIYKVKEHDFTLSVSISN